AGGHAAFDGFDEVAGDADAHELAGGDRGAEALDGALEEPLLDCALPGAGEVGEDGGAVPLVALDVVGVLEAAEVGELVLQVADALLGGFGDPLLVAREDAGVLAAAGDDDGA